MTPITIEYDERNGFVVRQADRYSDMMNFDEMLGLVISLTIPDRLPHLSWMKTQEEWDKYRAHCTWSNSGSHPKEQLLITKK